MRARSALSVTRAGREGGYAHQRETHYAVVLAGPAMIPGISPHRAAGIGGREFYLLLCHTVTFPPSPQIARVVLWEDHWAARLVRYRRIASHWQPVMVNRQSVILGLTSLLR